MRVVGRARWEPAGPPFPPGAQIPARPAPPPPRPSPASRPPYPVQQPLGSGRLRKGPGLPPWWQAAAATRGALEVPQELAAPVERVDRETEKRV